MTSDEVAAIIEDELRGLASFPSANGIDLQRCCVPPVLQRFEDSAQTGAARILWLVLEEMPEDHSGFKVVFDEESRSFGLAVRGTCGSDFFLGFHRSFLDALSAM